MVNTLIFIGLGIVIGFVLGNAGARAKLMELIRKAQKSQSKEEPPVKAKRKVIKLGKK
jgi:uncharacterized protein YneF (UPF0154 family)